jgi:PKD repeat protein
MKSMIRIAAKLFALFTVLLIAGLKPAEAQNSGGCTAQFTYQVTSGSMNVSFFPVGSVAAAQYSWNFGDGSLPSNLPNPQHLFLQPGAYWVCLSVTAFTSSGTSCTAQWCDSVRVGNSATGLCNPQFTWTSANVVNGIQFSPALNGNTAQYAWSFGDGGTSNQLNPSHVYPGPGAYLACLTVTNGTCVNTFCDTVRITNSTVNCDAHFSATATAANSSAFYFQPVSNTLATRYLWNFGDGTTDTLRTPTHAYAQPGAYWACLTVTRYTATGSVACSATWCDSVRVTTVNTNPCDAHFTYQFAQTTNAVYFNPAINPTGTVFAWDFGDGTTSSLRTPAHVYTQPGPYLVCLTVTTIGVNGGLTCTASWCDSVFISQVPNPCSARFAWAVNNSTQTASFRPQTVTTNSTYSWNFGDGTGSTAVNPVHQYVQPGVYWVCLTVTRVSSNTGGTCTDTWCDSVRVNAPLPPVCNAAFSFNRQFNAPLSFRFVPLTMAPGTTYYWTFGDGDTSTLRTPFHTYADTGVYQVCLTVTTVNSAGACSSTVCRTLVVRPLQPVNSVCSAYFQMNRIAGTPGLFQFSTLGSNGSMTYHWNFGDSTTSNLPNPVHQYFSPGSYTICLTVRDSLARCFNRFCRVLVLGPGLYPTDPSFEVDVASERIGATMDVLTATVYPNPASERADLEITGAIGDATFRMFDGTGRIVFDLQGVSDGTYRLPVSGLPSGIYYYRLTDQTTEVRSGRFIIR